MPLVGVIVPVTETGLSLGLSTMPMLVMVEIIVAMAALGCAGSLDSGRRLMNDEAARVQRLNRPPPPYERPSGAENCRPPHPPCDRAKRSCSN